MTTEQERESLTAGYAQQLLLMERQVEQQRLAIEHLGTLLKEQQEYRAEERTRQRENDADYAKRVEAQRVAAARNEERANAVFELHKASIQLSERQTVALEKIAETLRMWWDNQE